MLDIGARALHQWHAAADGNLASLSSGGNGGQCVVRASVGGCEHARVKSLRVPTGVDDNLHATAVKTFCDVEVLVEESHDWFCMDAVFEESILGIGTIIDDTKVRTVTRAQTGVLVTEQEKSARSACFSSDLHRFHRILAEVLGKDPLASKSLQERIRQAIVAVNLFRLAHLLPTSASAPNLLCSQPLLPSSVAPLLASAAGLCAVSASAACASAPNNL